MLHECPNCRERISFWRLFRTPAWGSFRCKACGSVLTISFARRVTAGVVWTAIFITLMEVFGLFALGRLFTYTSLFVSLLGAIYIFERVVLLDRRAFTCKFCGYDLQGLPESRCPECGAAFDPAERERIVARINAPAPRPKHRRLAALLVIVLALMVAIGLVVWSRVARKGTVVPAPTVPTKPAVSGVGNESS